MQPQWLRKITNRIGRGVESKALAIRDYLKSDQFETDLDRFGNEMGVGEEDWEPPAGEEEDRRQRILRKLRHLAAKCASDIAVSTQIAGAIGGRLRSRKLSRSLILVTATGTVLVILYRAGKVFVFTRSKEKFILVS